MAKMVDDYSILIQLIFLGENKFLVEWNVFVLVTNTRSKVHMNEKTLYKGYE